MRDDRVAAAGLHIQLPVPCVLQGHRADLTAGGFEPVGLLETAGGEPPGLVREMSSLLKDPPQNSRQN
jgi:hypothetical protein